MSAFEIQTLQRRKERPMCAHRCLTSSGLVRTSTTYVSLLGYPYPGTGGHAGYFCQTCANELEQQWIAALDDVEIVQPASPVCACGCGESLPAGGTWKRGHAGKDPSKRTRGVGSKKRPRGNAKSHRKVAA